MKKILLTSTAVALFSLVVHGCSGSDATVGPASDASVATGPTARGSENVGQSCTAASQCFSGVDGGALKGEVKCLDRVTGGYCTHLCQSDADCCAVPGECSGDLAQVCAPFEATGQMMCFLSCEAKDLRPAPDGGVLADSAYCQSYAGSDFGCRSSGGGNKNRKICVPGGTSSGTSDAGTD